jgi:hypothetical protein
MSEVVSWAIAEKIKKNPDAKIKSRFLIAKSILVL